MTNRLELRRRKLHRLAKRAAEAPFAFLVWKARERVMRVYWNRHYLWRASARADALQHTDHHQQLAQSPSLFRRDYSQFASAPCSDEHRQWILATARAARSGKVSVLGYGRLDFGHPIKWSSDPAHNVTWPSSGGLRVSLVPGDLHGDIKVPWELNRLQFLSNISQAWLISGDEDFLTQWTETLDSWSEGNPQGIGVAWSCAMEVAIRAANLVTSSAMMWPSLDLATRRKVVALLDEHRAFLTRHPEKSDISGNHYLVDVSVKLQLDLIIAQGHRSRNVERSTITFFREVQAQFTAEGLHFEFATNYHRYMTELILLTLVECERWGVPVPADVRSIAKRAVENCALIASPWDHLLPQIGDSDSGQILRLDALPANDTRYVVALGEYLLRGQAPGTSSHGAAWALAAPTGCATTHATTRELPPPPRISTANGYGVITTNDAHVVVRSGAPGLSGRGGHDHSDLTAPTISLSGRPVVVDPGTQHYTFSRAHRLQEISGEGHNTLLIDGQDALPAVEGSVMPGVSSGTLGHLHSGTDQREAWLRCGHDGFRSVKGVERYERLISVSLGEPKVVIADRLGGYGRHTVQSQWHFQPGIELSLTNSQDVQIINRQTRAPMGVVQLSKEWTGMKFEEYIFSAAYGSSTPGVVLRVEAEIALPCTLYTTLSGSLTEPNR